MSLRAEPAERPSRREMQSPAFPGAGNQRLGPTVLHTARWIFPFEFNQDFPTISWRHLIELHERRVPNGVQDTRIQMHARRLLFKKLRSRPHFTVEFGTRRLPPDRFEWY